MASIRGGFLCRALSVFLAVVLVFASVPPLPSRSAYAMPEEQAAQETPAFDAGSVDADSAESLVSQDASISDGGEASSSGEGEFAETSEIGDPSSSDDEEMDLPDGEEGAPGNAGELLLGLAQETSSLLGSAAGALAIGDCFISSTDEGVAVVYRVTSSNTVQVGCGSRGRTIPVNMPAAENVSESGLATISSGYGGALTIPSTVVYDSNVYTVTAVGDYAFGYYYEGMSQVTFSLGSINLPSTVTSIGAYAFDWCSLPGGVTSIGDYAFRACGIKSASLPATLTRLGVGVFSGLLYKGATYPCGITSVSFGGSPKIVSLPDFTFMRSCLQSIDIPSCVTTLGKDVFRESNLVSIVIPNTVVSLGTGVCCGCKWLTSAEIEAGSPLTEIPSTSFYGCTHLTSFEIPPFIQSIESSAFQGSALVSVDIPSTLTYLGDFAFADCAILESCVFAEGHPILSISEGLFENCSSLGRIDLPAGVRSIGDYAFSGCKTLSQIVIPSQVRSLGAFAFQECPKLKTVLFEGDASTLASDASTFYLSNAITSVVYLGKRSKTLTVQNAMPTFYYAITYYASESDMAAGKPSGRFVCKANSVPDAATPQDVFSGSMADPPEGMRWVVEDGFAFDREITDSFCVFAESRVADLAVGDVFTAETVEGVEVTYTVTSTADGGSPGTAMVGRLDAGFSSSAVAESITGAVTMPGTVVAPDAHAYTVTSVAPYAFANCSRFVEVTIPSTVGSIGAYAFYRASQLRNVYFESDASKILDVGIFASCSNISLVVFGGKKANVKFGSSAPKVYYTATYYDTEHDRELGNVAAKVLVLERSLLGSLSDDQVLRGVVPDLPLGYKWIYERGFAGDVPLTDSCYVYGEGVGFQRTVRVLAGNVSETPCWFKVVGYDEDRACGTVMVGLGVDGATAVGAGVSGTPVIPQTISDKDGNEYEVVGVSDYAFGSSSYWLACPYIASVSLPYTVAFIGESSFQNCISLASMALPSRLEKIGESAFRGCTALSRVSTLMSSKLVSIPAYAFCGDYMLESISIPSGVKTIDASAFEGCYNERLGKGMTSVDLSSASSLERVESRAFYGNALFDGDLDMPDSLAYVGDWAFYRCAGLDSLNFSSAIEHVGASAFKYCEDVRVVRFKGDAQDVTFGADALHFGIPQYWGLSGKLSRVEFMGKKSSTVTSYIKVGGDTDNDYRRPYRLYYNVTFYDSESDRKAGIAMGSELVREDSYAIDYAPELVWTKTWRSEDGFDLGRRTTDSFWACAGYDIGHAAVSGVDDSYYYTGSALRPYPTLTMPDGTVLVEGVHYVFDSSYGANCDGYVNNRRMGTAHIYLKGINEYSGQKVASFEIRAEADASQALSAELAVPYQVYDGTPKEPELKVTATFRGESYEAVEGEDYVVSCVNNVNAGTAHALVQGAGMFGSVFTVPFEIVPMNIARCNVVAIPAVAVSDGKVSADISLSNPYGDMLVEGSDFVVRNIVFDAFSVSGTIFIGGIGNYRGLLTLEFGRGSGEGVAGESGGGTGEGDNPFDGEGESGVVGSGSSSDREYGTVGASAASAVAGSEQGGSTYSVFGIGEADVGVEIDESVWWYLLLLALMLLLALLSGYLHQRKSFARQTEWWRDDGLSRGVFSNGVRGRGISTKKD